MLYFDTNVLIYTVANQGDYKTKLSKTLIGEAIKNQNFFISDLVLIEFIFTLSKLKILNSKEELVKLYSNFSKGKIDKEIVLSAFEKCSKFNKCRNINDFIHLEIANRYCKKIITYDSDFKNLQKFYNVEIEILGDNYEME